MDIGMTKLIEPKNLGLQKSSVEYITERKMCRHEKKSS